MKTVKEILASKDPQFNYITSYAKVIDALSLMRITNLSYVIVMDDNLFKGILSEHDYSQKVILESRHSNETEVKEIMSTHLQTVSLDDTAFKCMQLIHTFKTRYLPVFEGSSFKGVITLHDIMRSSMKEYEEELKRKNNKNNKTEFTENNWNFWA